MSKETPLPLTGAGRPAPSLIIPYTNTSPGVPPLLVHTAPVLRALLLLHVSTYHTLADVVHTLASSSRPGMQCRPCFSFIATDCPVPRAHLPHTTLSIVRRAIVPAVRRRGVLNTLNDTAGTGDPVYPPRFIGHRSRCTYFEPLLSHSTIPSWFTASCCCVAAAVVVVVARASGSFLLAVLDTYVLYGDRLSQRRSCGWC